MSNLPVSEARLLTSRIVLPVGGKVNAVTPAGLSEFCSTYRVDVKLPDGATHTFFQEVGIMSFSTIEPQC